MYVNFNLYIYIYSLYSSFDVVYHIYIYTHICSLYVYSTHLSICFTQCCTYIYVDVCVIGKLIKLYKGINRLSHPYAHIHVHTHMFELNKCTTSTESMGSRERESTLTAELGMTRKPVVPCARENTLSNHGRKLKCTPLFGAKWG